MKHFLLLFFFVFVFSSYTQAQEKRLVSGTLLDDSGLPIPGVAVVIKGTDMGTVTDVNGYYEIEAPIGATLIFSSVGFTTQEMLVTKENAMTNVQSPPKIIDSVAYDYSKTLQMLDSLDKSNSNNIGILQDNSPTYTLPDLNYSRQDKDKVHKIPLIYKIEPKVNRSRLKPQVFTITTRPPYRNYYNDGWKVNFLSSFSVQRINRLPSLQNIFAQGRPVNGENTWLGAETNESFSWGPALHTLEYLGNAYPYDRNGSLVPIGNGNGQKAKAYNSLDFLRNANQWHNSLQLSKDFGNIEFYAKLHYNLQNYIIPTSNSKQINTSLNTKWDIGNLRFKALLNYQNTDHQLPPIGANWQSILGAVYRTPISFDNANGLSRKDATDNSSVYLLPDGSPRSFDPDRVANPFALVSTSPDKKHNQSWRGQLGIEQRINYIDLNHLLGFESLHEDKQFGVSPSITGLAQGMFTQRDYKINRAFLNTSIDGRLLSNYLYNHEIKLYFRYQLQYEGHQLSRLDAYGFPFGVHLDPAQAAQVDYLSYDRNRFAHQMLGRITWEGFDNILRIYLENQTYFSSTLKKKNQAYFLPSVSARFQLGTLLNDWEVYFMDNISLTAVYSKSIQEAPMVYNQWHFNSTIYNSSDYAAFYEAQEILFQGTLTPERYRKLDLGIKINFQKGFDFNANFFFNKTKDMFVPVWRENAFVLDNAIDLRTRGWEIELSSYQHFYGLGSLSWNSSLSISRYNPIVTDVKSNSGIPLSGYQDMSSQLIKGQPFGVLVGSKYLRNESGKIIIDADGYPMIDPNPGVLGNPNPDYILAWNNQLRMHDFSLSFTLEYRHGGKIWNGTQQALNYLGRSKLSADQRGVTDYVFQGVHPDNTVNQTPVDFANPAQDLSDNRWVRYGWSGVAEEAIQKATWLRFSEVKLTYDFTNLWKGFIRKGEAKFSAYVKNILLYAPYSGIDSSTSLLDYRQGTGLDLFNTPATRSYGFQLELKF